MGHHLHPPRYSPCDSLLLDPFYQTRPVECTPSQRGPSLGQRMPCSWFVSRFDALPPNSSRQSRIPRREAALACSRAASAHGMPSAAHRSAAKRRRQCGLSLGRRMPGAWIAARTGVAASTVESRTPPPLRGCSPELPIIRRACARRYMPRPLRGPRADHLPLTSPISNPPPAPDRPGRGPAPRGRRPPSPRPARCPLPRPARRP
jgi:hypothetical protein